MGIRNISKKILLLAAFAICSKFLFGLNPDSVMLDSLQGKEKIEFLNQLTFKHHKTDLELAKTYNTEAINYLKEKPDSFLLANALVYKAYFYYKTEIYDSAKVVYYDAIATNIKAPFMCQAYGNLAHIYNDEANFTKALDNYLKQMELAEELNDTIEIAKASNSLAIFHTIQENYEKALQYNLKALEIFDKIGHTYGIISTNMNIGILYGTMQDYEKSLEYNLKTLKASENANFPYGVAVAALNIGENYRREKKFEDALKYFLMSEAQTGFNRTKYEVAVLKSNIGSLYYHTNQFNKAIAYLTEAADSAKALNSKKLEMSTTKELAATYSKIGNDKKAYDYSLRYIDLRDSVFNSEKNKQIEEMMTKYETEKKELEIQNQKLEIAEKNIAITRQKVLIYSIIGSVLIFILTGLFLFNRYRFKQLANRQALENKILDIQHRLMRAQMNPHFIYNSLNSIQFLIANNKNEIAENYLDKFARLMRITLESTAKPLIAIDDEINIITLYLELEKLRFENKFESEIHLDQTIDIENIGIPPMLIQPFVENSIKHGLIKKEGKSKIDIYLKSDSNHIKCTIIDNGIGREKAKELSKHKNGHKSIALNLVKERLQMSNKIKGDFQIIDLTDDEGKPKGTKVLIDIPFEELF